MADVIVITKTDAARFSDIEALESEIGRLNPHAPIMRSASIITIDDGARIRGRRVLVVEDGPTLTHGGMAYGAGYVAACREGVEIVDPRESATPEIMDIYEQYPHIGPVLPAIGYSQEQLAGLKDTIDRSRAEVIVIGTPFDFARHVKITKPAVRVTYEFADAGEPRLATMIDNFLLTHNLR
jgi:predicted GTPase